MTKYSPLLIFIILCCFLYFGNNSIQTTLIEVSNNKVPEEFNGYTIVQISDLHNKRFGRNQSGLISKIKSQQPDIIVVTGDLVDKRRFNMRYALDFMREAMKIAPVYYVTGNHEAWLYDSQFEELREKIVETGAVVLENNQTTLELDGNYINLFGINDPSFYFGDDMDDDDIDYEEYRAVVVDSTLSKLEINTHDFNILLSHRPELSDVYSKHKLDLVFAGHAHGGQFRIPFVGGLLAPNQGFFPKYTEGAHTYEDTTMIVSRGLGRSIIPFRIFNRPELVVCKLKRTQS